MSRNSDFSANTPEKSRGKAPSYIDYLNQFHRWRENHSPGDKVIVLYINMLDMFSRRYWPEWAGVTTAQLMTLANTTNKKTALSARDALVKAGFLEYRPGWKGTATVYKLLNFGVESDTEKKANACDTKNGCESVPPNYVRLNKDKDIPPNPPKGGTGGKNPKNPLTREKSLAGGADAFAGGGIWPFHSLPAPLRHRAELDGVQSPTRTGLCADFKARIA